MGKKGKDKDDEQESAKLRIAIVSEDKCKPKKCKQECKKFCPVVRTGKLCIEVGKDSKIAWISEPLCIGCGICVKKCPFEAINIINLPKDLAKDTTHRHGPNSFKLHRLPVPRPGQVLGLVGTNGIGKTTACTILAGKLKPNLGKYDAPPDWQQILAHFRGSELQSYFTKMLEDSLKAMMKPQYVDKIPKQIAGQVGEILEKKDDRKERERYSKELELSHLQERQIKDLSGGELQRFAIAILCVQACDVYMFDEPSSYLDVRQRLNAARVIRELLGMNNYIIVVEHDLAVLDYLSDFVCCLWGQAGGYGVVTMPFSVREGINIFLDGFVPTENLRFREVSLTFKVAEEADDRVDARNDKTDYPDLKKLMGTFQLEVRAGDFSDSEIIVMLGQNGTGKTTFIRMLAGLLKPDPPDEPKEPREDGEEEEEGLPKMNISYKPQTIGAKFEGSVNDLLMMKIRDAYMHPQFQTDVTKPMLIDPIKDQNVQHLSGGELQRVAITLALGKPADIFLIDEPSAYLDVEQRIVAARVIKRFILHAKKTAFVVEHDFIMATYLADRVIVYEGEPGVHCIASKPMSLLEGMNRFLAQLEISFRRDPTNFRPRINKIDSQKDAEQKKSGNYFVLDE
jgi:ATP-binding cassette subfamily E protein 1|mmetsp:Transcript_59300/g.94137  ORF Transcript_59300/g.94137 Transcript_59300/m.94137 type:complete len:625 (-) Transcript_59300:182-2056(-)|eukprot:CAMPEP_0169117776 /NCGR_PEP_ID=MMETSP1015-20121227/30644_1 /TAXON_ID=342587 /ORGANISM="Karlodinium micrum, Strain CCMP2283" /LENGTH=624 /DNA_ID=CAMNT_0009180493 /DNA_START=46 /DNA_END=1920 /DNA_ORIENTATION=+